MDKAEYRIKLEQINNLAENGDFKGAAAIADTIEWKKVRSVRTLCMIGEIYEANRRYSDSEQILKYAYRQSSSSKTVLYRLTEIEIRMGFYDEAKRYYQEFEELSPHDTSRYILKYKLLRAQGAPLTEQIEVLREYKEREYTERWAFELARLYKKNGQKQRCIEECDDMILWFAEGKYVTRAMELKMQLEPLSEAQQKRYDNRHKAAIEAERRAIPDDDLNGFDRVQRAINRADEEDYELRPERQKKVTAAEAIQKMNAAADEAVTTAIFEEKTPNVRPGIRTGRAVGRSSDIQDQIASSFREAVSSIRKPRQLDYTDLYSEEEEPGEDFEESFEESAEDRGNAELEALFAETGSMFAKELADTFGVRSGSTDVVGETPETETSEEPEAAEEEMTAEAGSADETEDGAAEAAEEAADTADEEVSAEAKDAADVAEAEETAEAEDVAEVEETAEAEDDTEASEEPEEAIEEVSGESAEDASGEETEEQVEAVGEAEAEESEIAEAESGEVPEAESSETTEAGSPESLEYDITDPEIEGSVADPEDTLEPVDPSEAIDMIEEIDRSLVEGVDEDLDLSALTDDESAAEAAEEAEEPAEALEEAAEAVEEAADEEAEVEPAEVEEAVEEIEETADEEAEVETTEVGEAVEEIEEAADEEPEAETAEVEEAVEEAADEEPEVETTEVEEAVEEAADEEAEVETAEAADEEAEAETTEVEEAVEEAAAEEPEAETDEIQEAVEEAADEEAEVETTEVEEAVEVIKEAASETAPENAEALEEAAEVDAALEEAEMAEEIEQIAAGDSDEADIPCEKHSFIEEEISESGSIDSQEDEADDEEAYEPYDLEAEAEALRAFGETFSEIEHEAAEISKNAAELQPVDLSVENVDDIAPVIYDSETAAEEAAVREELKAEAEESEEVTAEAEAEEPEEAMAEEVEAEEPEEVTAEEAEAEEPEEAVAAEAEAEESEEAVAAEAEAEESEEVTAEEAEAEEPEEAVATEAEAEEPEEAVAEEAEAEEPEEAVAAEAEVEEPKEAVAEENVIEELEEIPEEKPYVRKIRPVTEESVAQEIAEGTEDVLEETVPEAVWASLSRRMASAVERMSARIAPTMSWDNVTDSYDEADLKSTIEPEEESEPAVSDPEVETEITEEAETVEETVEEAPEETAETVGTVEATEEIVEEAPEEAVETVEETVEAETAEDPGEDENLTKEAAADIAVAVEENIGEAEAAVEAVEAEAAKAAEETAEAVEEAAVEAETAEEIEETAETVEEAVEAETVEETAEVVEEAAVEAEEAEEIEETGEAAEEIEETAEAVEEAAIEAEETMETVEEKEETEAAIPEEPASEPSAEEILKSMEIPTAGVDPEELWRPVVSPEETETLLGRETDESLGLTREFNFQEELRKAMGGDITLEEAAKLVYEKAEAEADSTREGKTEHTAFFLSPEEEARKTVMEAAGKELPVEEPEEESMNPFPAEPDGAVKESVKAAEEPEETEEPEEPVRKESVPIPVGEIPKEIFADESDEPQPVEAAEDMSDILSAEESEFGRDTNIIEHIMTEPEMVDRVPVLPRKFDETERKIFSYFSNIPGMQEQITLALADIHNNSGDKTSRQGNVLIIGRQASGKTRLAEGLMLAVCKDLHIQAAKKAKIIGEDLNKKDPAKIVKLLAGGFLLIEGAGAMYDETIEKLSKAMEFRTDGLVVILEDEKRDMRAMLNSHPELAEKFTSTIIVPVFTNDELVTFARTYARENGYKFDELATLALYTMIGENQKDSEPMTVGMVKDIVDQAIDHSKNRRFGFRSRNQAAPDGRILLREKDFS